MGLQGLQRVAATIIFLIGLAFGYFVRDLLSWPASLVPAGVASTKGATPAQEGSKPVKIGDSVIWTP